MKPSCWQLDGREKVKPHPAKASRTQYTLLTLPAMRRLDDRLRQRDWSRARVA